MAESEPIAWKVTSRMVFNQTARTPGKLGLSGVPQRLGRPLGRNSACSIVPRRDSGCSHQRKRANNKTPAGRRVGRSSISGDNPEGSCLISCSHASPLVGCITPPIERGCVARQTMAMGHLDWGREHASPSPSSVVAIALVEEEEAQRVAMMRALLPFIAAVQHRFLAR